MHTLRRWLEPRLLASHLRHTFQMHACVYHPLLLELIISFFILLFCLNLFVIFFCWRPLIARCKSENNHKICNRGIACHRNRIQCMSCRGVEPTNSSNGVNFLLQKTTQSRAAFHCNAYERQTKILQHIKTTSALPAFFCVWIYRKQTQSEVRHLLLAPHSYTNTY